MTITRRTLVLGAMSASLSAPLAAPFVSRAQAQSWPGSNVKIVVAYPPGGSTDAIIRLTQPALQDKLGTSIIIENRAGASGSVGTAWVTKSPPDGSTFLAVFDNHGANPFVLPNLPYDSEKDLDPVLLIGTAPYLLATSSSKPYNTLADVIDAARKSPGSVSYASVGAGSVGHLAMAQLAQRAGVKLVHVPYRGSGPMLNDLLGGLCLVGHLCARRHAEADHRTLRQRNGGGFARRANQQTIDRNAAGHAAARRPGRRTGVRRQPDAGLGQGGEG